MTKENAKLPSMQRFKKEATVTDSISCELCHFFEKINNVVVNLWLAISHIIMSSTESVYPSRCGWWHANLPWARAQQNLSSRFLTM